MLQTIREHTEGWITKIIITLIILSFALWGIHSYLIGATATTSIATVNDVEIQKEQLSNAYDRLRRQALMQGTSPAELAKNEPQLKKQALQTLIDMEALKQASIVQGYAVSDLQIDNYLQSMQDFQVDGRFSLERMQQVLASASLSVGDFLDIIKSNLLIEQPRLGTLFSAFATENEANATIRLINQTRDVSYLAIPTLTFANSGTTVSEAAVTNYYNEHKNDFMTKQQVSIEYVSLTLNDIMQKMSPTDAELQSFYNENATSYRLPMQWKLAYLTVPVAVNAAAEDEKKDQVKAVAIAEALKNGQDLKATAEKYAVALTMKDEWVTVAALPESMQKTVATLSTPDQVSDPVKSEDGFVIIKALAMRQPNTQSFAEVKDKVREGFIKQRAEEKFAELRDQLADLTYEHPDSLATAAKTLNLAVNSTGLFTHDSGVDSISNSTKVREIAFSSEVLNSQNNSDVIQLNPETLVVIRNKQTVPAKVIPLAEVADSIKAKLAATTLDQQTKNYANAIVTKLQNGSPIESVTDNGRFSWISAGFIGRYATKVDSAVLDVAFKLPNPASNSGKPVYGIAKVPSGYMIVSVIAVKDGAKEDDKQLSVFTEQTQTSQGLLEYELLKQSEIKQAKIVMN